MHPDAFAAARGPAWDELAALIAVRRRTAAEVLRLGATKHDHQPGTTFRVFLDPAGHPFCLCVD